MRSVLLLFLLLAFSSCVKYKDIVNFTEGPELTDSPVPGPPIPDLEIQVDDLVSIQVMALDVEATEPFNMSPMPGEANMMMNMGGNARPLIGYLVDKEGFIDFPVLGRIRAAGLTTSELKATIARQLTPYLNDPVVQIRFINFRISVLGEVSRPGNFILPNERITILDALSNAGDLTPYGDRTNILIVRDYNGERQYGRINLKDRNAFQSEFYYLRQNDIIYVEPMPIATAKTANQASRVLPWLSIVTSLTTLTLTVVNLSQLGGSN